MDIKKNIFLNNILIIAEVSQTHDGSLGQAHAFIDAVAETGANAIKFQTHYADEESTLEEPWRIKFSKQDNTRFDYWKRMEFKEEQWHDLAAHAHEKGLLFIASPFSVKAVDVLSKSNIDIWKIASGEITNLLMFEEIVKTKKPVIISSGMSSLKEIEIALRIFAENNIQTALLQCTSNYPVSAEKTGLNLIDEFNKLFRIPIGFSDHTGKIFTGLAAVTLGARIIEVHVTFHKKMFGPDVPSSLTIEELKQLVDGIQWIYKAINNPLNKDDIYNEFAETRKIFMKAVVAKNHIPKGNKIEKNDLAFKKPCIGIPASEVNLVIGKIALVDIYSNEFITPDKLI